MRRCLRDDRGAALVEFAIVSVLLITLVFGIIEFGMLMKDYLTVNQAAREGARAAALGATTTVIKDHIVTAAPTITVIRNNIVLKTGAPNTNPSGWAALGDANGSNNAVHGNLISVDIPYTHSLVTGGLLSPVFGGNSIIIHGTMIMGRE